MIPNQNYHTKPNHTKPNLPYQTKSTIPNQIYHTKPNLPYQTKPNIPNQTYQTKPNQTKLTLQYKTKPTNPKLLNQTYQIKPTKRIYRTILPYQTYQTKSSKTNQPNSPIQTYPYQMLQSVITTAQKIKFIS